MRSVIYRLFLILGFFLISLHVFDYISIAGQKPDILLILVIFVAQRRGVMEGQITGFFAGLVEDIFSVQLFGIHSFIKLIIGHIAGHIYTNFVVEHFGIQFVLGFVAALLQGILFILSKAVFAQIDVGYYLKTVLWIQVLYTAVLTPVFFAILNFMEKRFGEP